MFNRKEHEYLDIIEKGSEKLLREMREEEHLRILEQVMSACRKLMLVDTCSSSLLKSHTNLFFSELFESAPGGYLFLASDGEICLANNMAGNMLGAERRTLEGGFVWDFLEDLNEQYFRSVMDLLKGSGGQFGWDVQVDLEDNGQLTYLLSAAPHYVESDSDGGWGKILKGFSILILDVTRQRQKETFAGQMHGELALVNRLAHMYKANLDLEQVFRQVLDEIRSTMGVAGSLWLLDQETGGLVCQYASGPKREQVLGWELPPEKGVAGWVVSHDQCVVIDDAPKDPRHYDAVSEAVGLDVRSFQGEVIGVIQVMDEEKAKYDKGDLALLEALAGPAAIAVENARLFERLNRLRSFNENIVEGMQEGVILEDADGVITFVNPRMGDMLGYEPEDIIGHHWTAIVDPASLAEVEEYTAKRTQKPQRYTLFLLTKGCTRLPVLVSARPLFEEGEFNGVLTVFTDITHQKEREEHLRHLATHDKLTQLPDRELFQDRLEHAIARAKRNQTHVVVMLVDLDNFKEVNDTMGHTVGDDVIRIVADRLKHSIRQSDTVARFGGDEFIILLEDMENPDSGKIVAEKILKEVSRPLRVEGNEINLTASIGISHFPQDGGDFDTLLQLADRAMYRAKEEGESSYQVY